MKKITENILIALRDGTYYNNYTNTKVEHRYGDTSIVYVHGYHLLQYNDHDKELYIINPKRSGLAECYRKLYIQRLNDLGIYGFEFTENGMLYYYGKGGELVSNTYDNKIVIKIDLLKQS